MKKIRLPKRLAACVLAAAMLTTPAGAAFTDTGDHWAEDAIDRWSGEYSIIQGYEDGSFRPDAPITRGAFAGLLDRFLRFQAISPAETFSDTNGTYWEEAILKLHAAGVYLGNQGKAMPTDSITRQQAVTMIGRAFNLTVELAGWPFEDADLISEYARGYVAEMTARGYVDDTEDGYFRPTDPITRAEFVNILDNMIHLLVDDAAPVSGGEVYGSVLVNSADGALIENTLIYGDLILAPGAQGTVTMKNSEVFGNVTNFSGAKVETVIEEEPEEELEIPVYKPDKKDEAIDYSDLGKYTPGRTTGETITYDGKQYPVYADREKLQVKSSDFRWDGDRIVYTGKAFDTRFGIDVSAYQNRATPQETIDWKAVKADGVDFVMVRIGLRGTSTGYIYEDAYYEQNIRGAMEAGIETGVYFFAQAISVEEAIEEAEYVLSKLEDLEINGPVAYDWEMHDSSYRVYGTPKETATACAVAFCQRVEQAGYRPMVYGSQYVSYIKYDQGALAPYMSWYPEYKSVKSESLGPSLYYQMDYWQFSSSCSINGIGGKVDANIQFVR